MYSLKKVADCFPHTPVSPPHVHLPMISLHLQQTPPSFTPSIESTSLGTAIYLVSIFWILIFIPICFSHAAAVPSTLPGLYSVFLGNCCVGTSSFSPWPFSPCTSVHSGLQNLVSPWRKHSLGNLPRGTSHFPFLSKLLVKEKNLEHFIILNACLKIFSVNSFLMYPLLGFSDYRLR